MGAFGTLKRGVPMSFIAETQGTINISVADDYLMTWLEAFLIDRKAAGVADGTLHLRDEQIPIRYVRSRPGLNESVVRTSVHA